MLTNIIMEIKLQLIETVSYVETLQNIVEELVIRSSIFLLYCLSDSDNTEIHTYKNSL